MKKLLKKWKTYLLRESLNNYDVGGTVKLYHYSRSNGEILMLDPEYFLTHRNPYSRKDYNTSDIPRVFFYVDPTHAEAIVKQDSFLYVTEVPIGDVYDLSEDPLDLLRKSAPYPEIPVPDHDRVLRSLAAKPRKVVYGTAPESLLEPDQGSYKGAFYRLQGMDIVVWFEPIEVQRTEAK